MGRSVVYRLVPPQKYAIALRIRFLNSLYFGRGQFKDTNVSAWCLIKDLWICGSKSDYWSSEIIVKCMYVCMYVCIIGVLFIVYALNAVLFLRRFTKKSHMSMLKLLSYPEINCLWNIENMFHRQFISVLFLWVNLGC